MATMNLADITLPQEQVAIPGTKDTFGVGALSFTDIVALFRAHKDIASDMFMRFQGEGADKNKVVMTAIGTMIDEAPDLVCAIISCASGNGFSQIELAKRLPLSSQTKALESIARLTFGRVEDDGVKEFLNTVGNAIAVVTQTINDVTTALPSGSDKSDAT